MYGRVCQSTESHHRCPQPAPPKLSLRFCILAHAAQQQQHGEHALLLDRPAASASGWRGQTGTGGRLVQTKAGGVLSTVKGAIGAEDMIKLLEEETLLNTWSGASRRSSSTRYIGDIVVSVNPFKRTGNSTAEVQQKYVESLRKHEPSSALPPHIYTLIGQAYTRMRSQAKSLSVLISGESGAGKTEAMKLCVSHLGAVSTMSAGASRGGGGGGGGSGGGDVATRLMATNPIMEPIGNAKTVRNNNSSRFGKHFDIQFNESGQIIGAATSVYLLEKPRITNHMPGERNYHVFYMLCKAGDDVRAHGKLGRWQEYSVLNQEGTVEEVTTWSDEGVQGYA